MTTANQKGGYLKRLSVSRDGESTSITTFRERFLKKTENYVLQIPRFITSATPKLNLISEAMFSIYVRANVAYLLPAAPVYTFTPTNYRSWSELGRQMQLFFKGVSEDELDEHFIEFSVLDDGCFRLNLSVNFCKLYYIKVGPETQKKTGFPEYMFQVRGTEGTVTRHFDHTDGLKYLIETDPLGIPRFAAYQDDVTEPIKFDSRFPLDSFDTRISLDVIVTFPMSSRISVFNGKEGREFMLARFPLTDYKQLHSRIDVPTGVLSAATTIKEVIQTGLQDLTLTNPEMISVFMLPGTIYHANFQLNTRYYSEGKIVSVPTDMENGFWNIELLFSKKKT